MCKVKDVALVMLQKSHELCYSQHNRNYLMDYVKLHKLLYLGQCMVLAKHDMTLFEEPIYAHNCGPYIENELDFIVARYGFGAIEHLTDKYGQTPVILPLPFLRNEVVNELLSRFGTMSTEEIVEFTKNTAAYTANKNNLDTHPEISREIMKTVGSTLN